MSSYNITGEMDWETGQGPILIPLQWIAQTDDMTETIMKLICTNKVTFLPLLGNLHCIHILQFKS